MTPQPDQQQLQHIYFLNVSKSKINHTMKFGFLIKYNMKNIFLQKS